jgi:hypothetical protein
LRDAANDHRDRDVLILHGCKLHGAAVEIETRGRDFNGVTAGSKPAERKVTLRIDLGGADISG